MNLANFPMETHRFWMGSMTVHPLLPPGEGEEGVCIEEIRVFIILLYRRWIRITMLKLFNRVPGPLLDFNTKTSFWPIWQVQPPGDSKPKRTMFRKHLAKFPAILICFGTQHGFFGLTKLTLQHSVFEILVAALYAAENKFELSTPRLRALLICSARLLQNLDFNISFKIFLSLETSSRIIIIKHEWQKQIVTILK